MNTVETILYLKTVKICMHMKDIHTVSSNSTSIILIQNEKSR